MIRLGFDHPRIAKVVHAIFIATVLVPAYLRATEGESSSKSTAENAVQIDPAKPSSPGQPHEEEPDSDAYRRVKSQFDALGRTPTLDDFTRICHGINGEINLASDDFRASCFEFFRRQRPSITKEDLRALHMATRSAISDYQVTCQWRHQELLDGKLTASQYEEHEFGKKDEKLYFRRAVLLESGEVIEEHAWAYDGKLMRGRHVHGQGVDEFTNATVNPFSSRSTFYYAETHLFLHTMMFESREIYGTDLAYNDLPVFLDSETTAVLEEVHDADGHRCVVVGSPILQAWLAPELNFAVVRFVQVTFPTMKPARVKAIRELSNFVDCGNGIWLPQKVSVRNYDPESAAERLVSEDTLAVTNIKVNQGIDDDYFLDVIPKGAWVMDEVKALAYVAGEKGSIQGLLEDVINEHENLRSNRPATIWLIVGNSVVFVLVLFCTYRYRRRPLGEFAQ